MLTEMKGFSDDSHDHDSSDVDENSRFELLAEQDGQPALVAVDEWLKMDVLSEDSLSSLDTLGTFSFSAYFLSLGP